MSLALSICALFILLMQSVNRVQFLKTAYLLLLFELCPACSEIDIVHSTSIYASL